VGILSTDVVLTAKAGGGFTVSTESIHVHKYVVKYSDEGHWNVCACGDETTLESHTIDRGTCACGYHEHVYDENGYDEEHHWDACSCGNVTDMQAHTLKNGTCSCGYHKHVYDTVKYDVENHWAICACGESASEAEAHKLENGNCSCGYHKHIYNNMNYNDKSHWTVCDCGEKSITVSHIIEDGKCTKCQYTEKTSATPPVQSGDNVEQDGDRQNAQQDESKPVQSIAENKKKSKGGCAATVSASSLAVATLLLIGIGAVCTKKK